MIKPTIGRVVWYWPSKELAEEAGAQAYAALVTYVHSDYLVNLAVFDVNGDCRSRTHVSLYQAHPSEERPNEPHCEWVPYQKGQAAKDEEGLGLRVMAKRIDDLEAKLIALANTAAAAAGLNKVAADPAPAPAPVKDLIAK